MERASVWCGAGSATWIAGARAGNDGTIFPVWVCQLVGGWEDVHVGGGPQCRSQSPDWVRSPPMQEAQNGGGCARAIRAGARYTCVWEGGGVVCTGGGRDGYHRRLISNQFDQVV